MGSTATMLEDGTVLIAGGTGDEVVEGRLTPEPIATAELSVLRPDASVPQGTWMPLDGCIRRPAWTTDASS